MIPAKDFLEFVSQDFVVGLGWEGTRKDRKEPVRQSPSSQSPFSRRGLS
jgi:hypothetical protein